MNIFKILVMKIGMNSMTLTRLSSVNQSEPNIVLLFHICTTTCHISFICHGELHNSVQKSLDTPQFHNISK